jgi:hypothetical protein
MNKLRLEAGWMALGLWLRIFFSLIDLGLEFCLFEIWFKYLILPGDFKNKFREI